MIMNDRKVFQVGQLQKGLSEEVVFELRTVGRKEGAGMAESWEKSMASWGSGKSTDKFVIVGMDNGWRKAIGEIKCGQEARPPRTVSHLDCILNAMESC